jgi:hypothetical protein
LNSFVSETNANVTTQLLQVPGAYEDVTITGSPRRRNQPNVANTILPPDETVSITAAEMATQRRFSVVNEAMERHNTRRKNKRSQSVMYRPGQGKRVAKTLSQKT